LADVTGSLLRRIGSLAPALVRKIATMPTVLESVFSGFAPGEEAGIQLTMRRLIEQVRHLGIYLLGEMTFEEYARRESEVADLCVREIFDETLSTLGIPVIVVAVGKYGGMELNYASDLDLFLVHGGSGQVSQEELVTTAIRFEQSLREQAGYDVDTRVRPEGSRGLAVISLDAYEEYFIRRAAVWERQALLKMRVVAGEESLAKSYRQAAGRRLRALQVDGDVLEEIIAMRKKSEPPPRPGRRQFNVKRSPGGLMDAEYALQAAQLAILSRGGDALEPNTLAAFERIPLLIPELEFRFLRLQRHYLLLRKTQTAMRLLFERTSNAVPVSGSQMRQLALSLGYGKTEEFEDDIAAAQKETREDMRAVFERLRGLVSE
jgi:glutamate-ammonia-ligase adenylyltransferase